MELCAYVFEVTYKYVNTIRNEFGWVEGHAPSDGNIKERTDKIAIASNEECLAIAYLKNYYLYKKEVDIRLTKKIALQAIIKAEQLDGGIIHIK